MEAQPIRQVTAERKLRSSERHRRFSLTAEPVNRYLHDPTLIGVRIHSARLKVHGLNIQGRKTETSEGQRVKLMTYRHCGMKPLTNLNNPGQNAAYLFEVPSNCNPIGEQ